MTDAALCSVRGLVVRYGDTVAVDQADLDVAPGRITALLGASGCGKTSLLRAIAGFGDVAAGEITIAGQRVVGPDAWVPPERRRVGMVFQEGALFPHLTVVRNVGYGLRGDAAVAARVGEVLRLVGLEGLEHRFPDQLSGGQQQRVALARALAPRPSLVLLDEPFASLDAVLRVHLREEVRRILGALGATAVLVTHEQEEALSIADVVAVMERGRVVQAGSPEEVYHRPATAGVATFVGGGQLLPCEVVAGRTRTALGEVRVTMVTRSPGAGGAGRATSPIAGESVESAGLPALLLVRPEDIEVLPADAATGALATVRRRQFFGHDAIDELALLDAPAGTGVLRARHLAGDRTVAGDRALEHLTAADEHAVEGDRVRLRLRDKTYTCYPRGG